MKALLLKAVEALKMAHAGLEWYRDGQPENVNGSDDEADEIIDAAIADLEAAIREQPGEASGWKLVPVVPTNEMIDAGAEHTLRVADVDPDDVRAMKDARNTSRGCVMAAYMDMVSAAPVAAVAPLKDEGEARAWNPEPPCWLVERRKEGRTVGYLGHACGSYEWMPTPDKATRFVRREDANGVAECMETEEVIVAEHIWG